MEEKLNDTLLAFVDFIYAVVFSLVVAEAYEEIVNSAELAWTDKLSGLLLVIGVFYFLSWDWLHGRLLTLRNSYTRYRRFFIEAIIAFIGYGAALAALQRSIFFLAYASLILLLGAVWAYETLKDHPGSEDGHELKTIILFQLPAAVVALVFFGFYLYNYDDLPIEFRFSAFLLFSGWSFVFGYEFFQVRKYRGIMFGPGIPFVSRERLEKIKQWFERR